VSEPTTPSGRALVPHGAGSDHVRELVVATERQARALLLDELEAAVRDPERFGWTGLPVYAIAYAEAVRDVLALIQQHREAIR
jgi:hypothetical protein